MNKNDPIVIAGAGGFIGGHLTSYFLQKGFSKIIAVDIKPLDKWYQVFSDVKNIEADLKNPAICDRLCKGARFVFNLAADMGGMGFIEKNKAACMLSVLINTNLLISCKEYGVERYFFASSACVYAAQKQKEALVTALKEEDAYPAMPEDGYGWEKLFSERMCRHFYEDFGLETRVARYHNVYGPFGTFDGGREKAPAALCRKIIEAKLSGNHEIEIWGDGEQTRSFMYIDDCILGTNIIFQSHVKDPINLGRSELVTINQMVSMIEEIAGVSLKRRYILDAPLGVRGRNSDNSLILKELSWQPSISLQAGLEKTYSWIYDQMIKDVRVEVIK